MATASHSSALASLLSAVARDCLNRLQTPGDLADEDLVHDLRVATKRLRAAWHLAKPLAPRGFARRRRRALAGISGLLSPARDLAVLRQLALDLASRQRDPRAAEALQRFANSLAEDAAEVEAAPGESALERIRQVLAEETEAWERIATEDPRALRRAARRALRRSLDRARRDAREALRGRSPGLWHDWRKAVKRLRYQREFVAAMQGRNPGVFDARISRLGTRLGQRNDLANLAARADALAASDRLGAGDHGPIRGAIAREESHLVRHCRRLGRLALLR